MIDSSTCLYYPAIDPPQAFVRRASLFWDSVSTIVPDGFDAYRHDELKAWRDAEFLRPEIVTPSHEAVRGVEEDALEYLNSPTARTLVSGAGRIHKQKVPRLVQECTETIHRKKMGGKVRRKILKWNKTSSDWVLVSNRFARFYMTLLATEIARSKAYAVVTDLSDGHKLANQVKSGVTEDPPHADATLQSRAVRALAEISFTHIQPRTDTSVKKLIRFSAQRASEKAEYRAAILDLAAIAVAEAGTANVEAHCKEIYRLRVAPKLRALEAALSADRLIFANGLLELSAFGTAALVAASSFGPLASLVAAGIALSVKGIQYKVERDSTLRNSPYSFLYLAKGTLGSRPHKSV